MKQKLPVMKTPPPRTTDEQPHDTEKFDPPSLMDKQILIEERIDNYAITTYPIKSLKRYWLMW